uniref:Uncharacterized protein n=1 Tax=Physcomitrium patens TaxID=3218 RepID=A0A7I4EUY3_PHYPA
MNDSHTRSSSIQLNSSRRVIAVEEYVIHPYPREQLLIVTCRGQVARRILPLEDAFANVSTRSSTSAPSGLQPNRFNAVFCAGPVTRLATNLPGSKSCLSVCPACKDPLSQ